MVAVAVAAVHINGDGGGGGRDGGGDGYDSDGGGGGGGARESARKLPGQGQRAGGACLKTPAKVRRVVGGGGTSVISHHRFLFRIIHRFHGRKLSPAGDELGGTAAEEGTPIRVGIGRPSRALRRVLWQLSGGEVVLELGRWTRRPVQRSAGPRHVKERGSSVSGQREVERLLDLWIRPHVEFSGRERAFELIPELWVFLYIYHVGMRQWCVGFVLQEG